LPFLRRIVKYEASDVSGRGFKMDCGYWREFKEQAVDLGW